MSRLTESLREAKAFQRQMRPEAVNRASDSLDKATLSALRGAKNAVMGTVNTALHPIQTGQAVVAALRNPIETGKSVASQLKSDFNADPIQTVVENVFPTPGFKGPKPRKIMVPENLAYKSEKDVINELRNHITKDVSSGQYSTLNALERAKWAEDLSKQYDGWFPWERNLWKDIGPAKTSKKFAEAPEGTAMELYEAIDHPEFLMRTANAPNMYTIKALRGNTTDLSGGVFVSQGAAKYRAKKGIKNAFPHVEVGGSAAPGGRLPETMNHELMHFSQDRGGLPEPYLGTDLSKGRNAYLTNPGEVQARVSGLRGSMLDSPHMLDKFSAPRLLYQETRMLRDPRGEMRKKLQDTGELARPTLYDHITFNSNRDPWEKW